VRGIVNYSSLLTYKMEAITMKKLFLFSLLSSILSMSALFIYTNQNTHKAHTTHSAPLQTYTYKLTKINSEGYYGHSTKDDTGIYFTAANTKGLSLHVNDKVNVSFPKDDYETITKISKVDTK
jgi:hypothetical protein